MPTRQIVPQSDLPDSGASAGGGVVPAHDLPDGPSGGPSPLVHGLKEFGAQVNPIEGAKGLAQTIAHPIDTIMADGGARQRIWNDSKAAFGNGDYATGAAKAIYSMIPFLGPNMARSGDQLASGDIAGGVGSTLGQGVALAGPKLLEGVKIPGAVSAKMGSAAESLYKGALKPSAAIPAERAAGMVKTGLQERIPITPDAVDTLSNLIDEVNGRIRDQIDAAGPGRTITGDRAVANTKALQSKFAQQVNPVADLDAIDASKQAFETQLATRGGSLTAQEAQAMKTGTYQQLKSRSYGELKSATVEAQKALARGLKDELNEQFPELQNLNARDSALLQLQPVLERAVQRASSRTGFSSGGPVVGAASRVVSGSGAVGVVAGTMKAVFDSPGIRSQLAIALSRASGATLPVARARILGYVNALGQSVSDETSGQSAD